MNWIKGRQDSGYYKCKLFESKLLKCDAYILKFPTGSSVPRHKDEVNGYNHYRFNYIWGDFFGGQVNLHGGDSEIEGNNWYLFRPDLYEHSVSKVFWGTRYVLSIGWLR